MKVEIDDIEKYYNIYAGGIFPQYEYGLINIWKNRTYELSETNMDNFLRKLLELRIFIYIYRTKFIRELSDYSKTNVNRKRNKKYNIMCGRIYNFVNSIDI